MKSTGRHHKPVTNELAKWLADHLEEWRPHFPLIGIVAGVVLVGAIIYLVAFSGEDLSSASSWQAYYAAYGEPKVEEALKNVAEKQKGTPAGRWATLAYADQQLRQATQQLVQNPKEAKTIFDRVEKSLKEAEVGASDKVLLARIHMSLAKTCESANKIEEARKYYAAVITDDGEGTFGKAAAKALKRLDKGSDVPELIAWLGKQDSTTSPKATGNPFDFGQPEALPERPDLSIPGEMKLGGPSPLGPSPLGPSPLGPSPLGPSPLEFKGPAIPGTETPDKETPKSETPKAETPKGSETKSPAVPTPVKPAVPTPVKPKEEKSAEPEKATEEKPAVEEKGTEEKPPAKAKAEDK
jgi:hypothetical protein